MEEPNISWDEARAVVDAKPFPKVTEQSIKDKIATVEYVMHGIMTVCFITMKNGFIVTDVSAPASPENYDKEVGERYAYDNAFRKLWQLEGYLLREKLTAS